ncbi:MAG: glycoside hydrolase family 88 protein, partial [Prevotella sp.]|nr:glycoside hydrolase family 88 protein [Prevotella sp.]
MKKMLILSLTALLSLSVSAQTASEVLETARLANHYFMKKYADPTLPTFVGRERPSSLWTRGVYYEGLMALYEIDPDEAYAAYTDKWADFHKWTARNGNQAVHADDQCCQQTYIDRYIQTGKKNQYMISEVIKNLKHQMGTGKVDYWTWIDAIQMSMPVYAKMYNLTGERDYMDYAMKLYRWTRNDCGGGTFNTKTGLWYRDADFVPPYKEKDGNDCYWSRGDGWVYAALVRVMGELSPKDKYYKELKKDFLLMSRALAKCQREDGLWNVSLVSPATFGGKELTGTSLFLYGMSWGLRQG